MRIHTPLLAAASSVPSMTRSAAHVVGQPDKQGNFSIDYATASAWLRLPNPNGRPNSDVVRPLWNGKDLTTQWEGRWTVDFGPTMEEDYAMPYEAPFAHVLTNVKPVRLTNNRKARAEKWWRHGEARPAMRKALSGLGRYIATSEKSKHRFFV